MTRKGKFILAGLAAATVGLSAAGAIAQRAHYWEGHHKGRHLGHGGPMGMLNLGFGGPHGRICRGDSAEFADIMLVRMEHRLKPTDAQEAVFDEFKQATRTAAEKLREACPKRPERTDDGERVRRTAVERLADTQAGLEASLDALKVYRPAAEKLYAALSDEQKAKVDRRGGKHGGKHGKWERGPRHDKGERHRGPDREPDTQEPDDKG